MESVNLECPVCDNRLERLCEGTCCLRCGYAVEVDDQVDDQDVDLADLYEPREPIPVTPG